MEIYSGPSSTGQLEHTDSSEPKDYIDHWKSGRLIPFSGTRDGNFRFRTLGLKIEEDDVVALFNALVERYKEKESRLRDDVEYEKHRVERLEATKLELEEALAKIRNLVRYHRNEAPSAEALLEAIMHIANHYRYRHEGKPAIEWIQWDSIESF